MSTVAKWTLQLAVLFLFAWLASVAGQWSSKMINGTSSERLAQLQPAPMLGGPVTAAVTTQPADGTAH
ncbi:hypothetical protein NRB16_14105 [Pseudomonas sp. LJDD11]|uniref:hypothetical protein n=1 Tax=unclassified Pseudomonas TaxID=196821 RepID=UPI0004F66C2C|nr:MULTISPECIES: hypothetical protein [unclassified Pseudomonas]MCQ9424653.1 hypothetical protein [Pseudomonas sp. LJDD11]BAP43345.1 putative uncharacterized protein [Pseudomonas sp. StFLB209]